MKTIKHFFTAPGEVEKIVNLKQLREHLLKSLLSRTIFIGAGLYIIALIPVISRHLSLWYPIIYTTIFIWLAIINYVKLFSLYFIRAFSFLFFLYILGIVNLFLGGMRAGAALFFLTFIALFTLLAGMRGGIAALMCTAITIVVMGFISIHGYIKPNWTYSASEPSPWFISGLAMILMGILLAISISTLIRSLDEQLRKAVSLAKELSKAYDATIEGWSRALDLRDQETDYHTKRVTEITLSFAKSFGVTDDGELINIRRGALLHDMGKIGVPDHILFKPGALTVEEMKIIRMHPQKAFDMLSSIEYLRPSLDIPLYHHERWDGTGYPFGLHEEQIPLSARIFAVIDVWDALISKRPYHDAWKKEDAIEYIKSKSGTDFDPKVVDAFLEWYREEKLLI